MRHRLLLASVLAFGVPTCGDQDLSTGSATPPTGARAVFTPADTSRASSTCKAVVRARDRARIRLLEAPTDSVVRNKAATFDALAPEACA
jgi:hypothetical protein